MTYDRKLLFTDGLSAEGRLILEAAPRLFDFEIHDQLSRSELLSKIADIEVLSIRTRTQVDSEILKAGKKLKLVARAGTGVDHIDLECAKKLGIAVMNTASANSVSAAELSLGLLLSAMRSIPTVSQKLSRGEWAPTLGLELHRRTAGIIGLGRVGRLVATRLQAFGVRVIANDPYKTQDYADQIGVRLMSFSEVLEKSSIISLHTPLTNETRRFINASALSKLSKGSFLINTARGGIVDETAILSALESRLLRAYAADVFETEPLPHSHPFLHHPSILLTPHMGAQTAEAQRRVNEAVASQILHYFQSGTVESLVELY